MCSSGSQLANQSTPTLPVCQYFLNHSFCNVGLTNVLRPGVPFCQIKTYSFLNINLINCVSFILSVDIPERSVGVGMPTDKPIFVINLTATWDIQEMPIWLSGRGIVYTCSIVTTQRSNCLHQYKWVLNITDGEYSV